MTQQYYTTSAAAFIRAIFADIELMTEEELVAAGIELSKRFASFKQKSLLPRVQKVINILKGLAPQSLVDVGTGRGAFLWPLLSEFPHLQVTCIDRLVHRIDLISKVGQASPYALSAHLMDVCQMSFADRQFDVATALEVLEHLEQPQLAVRELVRVTKKHLIISVPAKEDDNPEHIQLFTKQSMTQLLQDASVRKIDISYVLNHMIVVASL